MSNKNPNDDRWPWPLDVTYYVRANPDDPNEVFVGWEAEWYGEMRGKFARLKAPWHNRLDNILLVGVLTNITEDARAAHKALTLNRQDGASADSDAAV